MEQLAQDRTYKIKAQIGDGGQTREIELSGADFRAAHSTNGIYSLDLYRVDIMRYWTEYDRRKGHEDKKTRLRSYIVTKTQLPAYEAVYRFEAGDSTRSVCSRAEVCHAGDSPRHDGPFNDEVYKAMCDWYNWSAQVDVTVHVCEVCEPITLIA